MGVRWNAIVGRKLHTLDDYFSLRRVANQSGNFGTFEDRVVDPCHLLNPDHLVSSLRQGRARQSYNRRRDKKLFHMVLLRCLQGTRRAPTGSMQTCAKAMLVAPAKCKTDVSRNFHFDSRLPGNVRLTLSKCNVIHMP